jgi:glycerol-3-phosphate dehydrogenase
VSALRTISGYRLALDAGGQSRELHCAYLVNAGGPWINDVLARVEPEAVHRPIDRVQGSHLVLDQALHAEAFYLESPIDQRAVFVLPWKGKTLLGTTERAFEGDPAQAAGATVAPMSAEDEAYYARFQVPDDLTW